MKLPIFYNLQTEILSSVFKTTTNSYKYYWFISILEESKSQRTQIPIDDLIIRMISNVWYPVNYFRLSFGKQDQLSNVIINFHNRYNLKDNLEKEELIEFLQKHIKEKEIDKTISKLSRYVPYRFLAPWFKNNLLGIPDSRRKNKIEELSIKYFKHNQSPVPYKIENESIIINSQWFNYFLKNTSILFDFTYWNLIEYLRKRNPNVPSLSEKLFRPKIRNLSNARNFWRKYILATNDLKCIYSQDVITINNFSIDHFVPWSFVSHDQLWNLLPTTKAVNSSKGECLPSNNYLNDFISLQYIALKIMPKELVSKTKMLEDYTILFNDSINNIVNMRKSVFASTLKKNIIPLLQIAKNMGFPSNWVYKK